MSQTVREFFGLDEVTVWTPKGTGLLTSPPEIVMGLELEIENCPLEGYRIPGWTVTTDGSLRGANNPGGNAVTGNAFEFISQPMRQTHLASELLKFFELTKFNEKNYSDRCSIHVHVNCQEYQFPTVGALAMLYTVVEECLFHFIGHERENNIYCVPWYQCRMNYFAVGEIMNGKAGHIKEWQKYTALNLQPLRRYGTVEFRHMEGTADVKRIHQWMNIIGCLFRYAEQNSIDSIQKRVMSLNSNSEYRQFFESVFGEYLPWNHDYQQMLEVGVINAKMGVSKPDVKPDSIFTEILAAQRDAAFAPPTRTPIRPRYRSEEYIDAEGTRRIRLVENDLLVEEEAQAGERFPEPAQVAPAPAQNARGMANELAPDPAWRDLFGPALAEEWMAPPNTARVTVTATGGGGGGVAARQPRTYGYAEAARDLNVAQAQSPRPATRRR